MEEFTLNEFVFQGLRSVLQTPPENDNNNNNNNLVW